MSKRRSQKAALRLPADGTQAVTQLAKARIHYADGRIEHYNDQKLAFAVWLALPKGILTAFRGANDDRPVYSWDYVDV